MLRTPVLCVCVCTYYVRTTMSILQYVVCMQRQEEEHNYYKHVDVGPFLPAFSAFSASLLALYSTRCRGCVQMSVRGQRTQGALLSFFLYYYYTHTHKHGHGVCLVID